MVVPEDIWNAAFEGHVAPVQAWLDSGGDPSDVDETGFTLIYRALQQQVMTPGRSAVVRLVVARGADICQVSANFPLSPLHQAMLEWNEASIDLLLELGADATANLNTPLEYVLSNSDERNFCYFNVAVLAKLLRAGASLEFLAAGDGRRTTVCAISSGMVARNYLRYNGERTTRLTRTTRSSLTSKSLTSTSACARSPRAST